MLTRPRSFHPFTFCSVNYEKSRNIVPGSVLIILINRLNSEIFQSAEIERCKVIFYRLGSSYLNYFSIFAQ